MKQLNRIKLTVLNLNEIADKEQRLLKGGADYKCGCISNCLEEMCACIEDGANLPKETAMEAITSIKNMESEENTILDRNTGNI